VIHDACVNVGVGYVPFTVIN